MEKWDIVVVVSALIGSFLTIGKPITALIKEVAINTVTMKHYIEKSKESEDRLLKEIQSLEEKDKELEKKDKEQDVKINDHEFRIKMLEGPDGKEKTNV